MLDLREAAKRYLESTLGVGVDQQAAVGLKMPFFLSEAYTFVRLILLIGENTQRTQLPILLILPMEDRYIGAVALRKHISQIQKATSDTVLYASRSLSSAERRSLITHQINFIQPGYQMFIPELAMDLREHVRNRRHAGELVALLPAAQAMLLGCLYNGWNDGANYTSTAIMGNLKYSRVTLSKVVDQLLKTRIVQPTGRDGSGNLYSFAGSPAEVFEIARTVLRTPVKRKVCIDRTLDLGNGVFLAGESALAEYTMLAGPATPVYGMTRKCFDERVEANVFQVAHSVDETFAQVEVWSYASLEHRENRADEASLLLSLDNHPDERVQLALDELKGRTRWLR